MTRRNATILLLPPLLLLLAACAAAWWILHTPSGTRWLWDRVAAAVPGELAAESLDGALADAFSVRGLRYANDGVEVTIASAGFSLDPDLLPPAATLSGVRIGAVEVRLKPSSSPGPEGGVGLRDVLSALAPPVPLHVESLALEGFRVLSPDGRRLFAMEGVALAGDLQRAVELARARLHIGDLQIEASGRLGLRAPYAVRGRIGLHIDRGDPAKFPGTPVVVDAALDGDLEEMQIDVASDSPQFRITGTVFEAGLNPRWDLRLRSDRLQWPFAGDAPRLRASAVDLASRGRPDAYDLAGTAVVAMQGSEPLDATLDAAGDTRGLDVRRLELDNALLSAAVRGELDWLPEFAVGGAADVARVDPHRVWDGWPAGHEVSGDVEARWRSGGIELSRLRARVENSPMTLQASGTVGAASAGVDLALDWRGLRWPVAGDPPRIESETGRVRLAGTLDDWRVEGRVALAATGFPEGAFSLRGNGDRERVAVTVDESRILGGSAAGVVRYAWHDGGRWSASVTAENLHTAPVVPDWPGVVNVRFDAEGQMQPLQISLDIDRFDGSLRDLPVHGNGGVRYRPGELKFRHFRAESGASSAEIDGDLASPGGIDFELDVAAVDAFTPAAAGAIEASGSVALRDGFPVLDLELKGEDLVWQGARAATLSLSAADGGAGQPIRARLTAAGVALDDRSFETVTANLRAGPGAQAVDAEVAAGDATLAVALDGAFEDSSRPLAGGWRGRLESLDLEAGQGLALALQSPAGVLLSRKRIALEDACLAGGEGLEVCGGGHWSGTGDFRADATLATFPVDMLRLVVDTGLDFTQTLDGEMTFSRAPGRALSGEVRLDVSGGRIRNRLDARLETTTRPGRLELRLEDGQLLSGQLELPFSEASRIDAEFEVLDVARGQDSPVEGRLNLRVADIGVAAGVVPVIDAAAGQLEAHMTVAGTLGQPQFDGQGSLRRGRLDYEPLGLSLRDLEIGGVIKDGNRLELEGTFTAGAGSGRLYTSADYRAGRQAGLQVSLSGTNLTVIDVPDLRVVANPELEFGLHEGTASVNGRVVIPEARLRPANLTAKRIRESEDVVVVAGADPAAAAEAPEESSLAINGTVELVLGDDIVVDLDNTEARISGRSKFRWSGPLVPVANGQYAVTGRFQAYGQVLDITEGTVGFANVPADNPDLRIRAEREIFGNSQVRSAGVLISGTAKDPEVEVYTVPETTEARALTLLVTGSDFNYEQGVGAVDVGTYIAPKLYLSYGIGLFDRENVISVRYDIAKGFGIKASSSARTDGVDLSYTIER